MGTSRRSFLKQGTLVALALGVPASLADKVVGRVSAATSNREFELTRAAFAAQLNTTFRIENGASRVAVKLIEVVNLAPRKTASAEREAFVLSFRGDHATPLKQDTYVVEHDRLGTFSFLVVPVVSRDQSARYYEAVINRLHP